MERGKMRIEVTFTINVDGILSISIRDILAENKINDTINEYKNDISEDAIDLNLDFLDIVR